MTFATLNENGPYQSVRNPFILDFLFQNSRFHAWVDLPFLPASARQSRLTPRQQASCGHRFAFISSVASYQLSGKVSLKVSPFFEGNSTSNTSVKLDDHQIWDLEYFLMVSPKVSPFFEQNYATR